jgi:hypothetical protein
MKPLFDFRDTPAYRNCDKVMQNLGIDINERPIDLQKIFEKLLYWPNGFTLYLIFHLCNQQLEMRPQESPACHDMH